MKTSITTLLLLAVAMAASAKITVTKQTCNYQPLGMQEANAEGQTTGGVAVTRGDISVGWQLLSDTKGDKQTAYQVKVIDGATGRTAYDTGRRRSNSSQQIQLPALRPQALPYYWQVRVWDAKGKPSAWSDGQQIRVVPECVARGFDEGRGATAQWIGAITRAAAKLPEGRWSNGMFQKEEYKAAWADVDTLSARSIVMRKEFSNGGKAVADAVVYVSGMGHYELRINGQKVGDSEFAPLWSEYNKTVYYNTYDITSLLQSNGNAISVLLGNGFFNVQRLGRYGKLQTSFGAPQLLLRMEITYADGTRQSIVSGTDWRYALSPITYNSIYGGESYDARLEHDGCDRAGYDDSLWQGAVAVEGPSGRLTPQTTPPVKIMERYGIQSITKIHPDSIASASKATKREVSPTAFLCDMGQNLAGFPEITVSGQRGQKVTLIVGETLTKQNCCDQRQTGRQHYYEYTLRGDGNETWHPRFSYYGFRYIQVEGAVMEGEANPDKLPVIKGLNSCFVYNSAEEVSAFECSNPLFTATHRLIERAERSNMQAVLSDCPHREKLGWLEQDHLNGPSLLYNYDMTTYVPKVIHDIVDAQHDDGMVPTVAPQYVSFGNLFDDSPEWGSTLIILPFMYYEQYGDSTLITRNYTAMRRYVDYLTSRADKGIVSHGLGDWYDYGPWRAGFSRNTPIPLVATAHYIYDLQLISQAATMVGNTADAEKYATMKKEVTEAFNREFYKPDSLYYGTGSQASNAIPLWMGLAEECCASEGGAASKCCASECGAASECSASEGAVASGCGIAKGERPCKQAVLQSLVGDIEAHGNRLTTGDVGNRYLFQTLANNGLNELLYTMLNHDETPGYGYQLRCGATTLTEQWDPVQGTSQNHFMMGQIDEWLFTTLGGIRNQPGTVGLRHLLINPTLVGDLEYVNASTETLYGKVAVSRTRHSLTVDVPVNCDAIVVLPNGTQQAVGSGQYTFSF